eukprot:Anaeramoba_flamelloidesc42786_g2_i2.p1 GENE.c42786_g2_i2~~c42786_g2_i2.p1  ORF type:complete len:480 (-),score=84.33 c42786_g2_i2:25-1464(-)
MKFFINPGKSLGPFKLGRTLSTILSLAQKYYSIVGNCELIYDQQDPLLRPMVLWFRKLGVKLHFCSKFQRLIVIEFNFDFVTYHFEKSILAKNGRSPRLDHILRIIGPSYPGNFNDQYKYYLHHYQGLTFSFPIAKHLRKKVDPKKDISDLFPDKAQLVAKCGFVYHGESFHQIDILPFNFETYYGEEVFVVPQKGLFFQKRDKYILFQHSIQDILLVLGKPERVYLKTTNGQKKMLNHNEIEKEAKDTKIKVTNNKNDKNKKKTLPTKTKTKTETGVGNTTTNEIEINFNDNSLRNLPKVGKFTDYIWNYFQYGLDIIINGKTHQIKKFVLHTNFPNSIDFNIYQRCNYRIQKRNLKTNKLLYIDPFMKLGLINKIIGKPTRSLLHARNFFPSEFDKTDFYGFLSTNIIVEIFTNTKYASTVVIFNPKVIQSNQLEKKKTKQPISLNKKESKKKRKKEKKKITKEKLNNEKQKRKIFH